MKTVVLILIVVVGAAIAWLYLYKPVQVGGVFGGVRPWRRLGAAICSVMTVMFVAGVLWLDEYQSPFIGLIYWVIMMIMALWLCLLALKDIRYTQQAMIQKRSGRPMRDELDCRDSGSIDGDI